MLSAACWWATSWAVYSLDDGHFSPVGDSLTVAWLALMVVLGALTALRGYADKDTISHYIVLLGVFLAGLLFTVAVSHPEGFLEVQIGIIASLIVAFASSATAKPRKKRRSKSKTSVPKARSRA